MSAAYTFTAENDSAIPFAHADRFVLLENGEEYFPAVFAAIAAARKSIFIETFILFEDKVGHDLQTALMDAARRGVQIDLTVDGYGSPNLSHRFIEQLTMAGVRLHIFDPRRRVLGLRAHIFRRMHRKIVAIDGATAFIGGINFGADHLLSSGDRAKQDYAVRVDGPLALEIHTFAQNQVASFYRAHAWTWAWRNPWLPRRLQSAPRNAALVVRDNNQHRDDIERHYRRAILGARRDILIGCAYFFPGYRLLRDLSAAARRGVAVKLVLQGEPDMPQAMRWTRMLYPALLQSGVEVHEYCERPLHAKVAVIDDQWCTIGSSNLDPLSLALNLEANIVALDRSLNRAIRTRLERMLKSHCRRISIDSVPRRGFFATAMNAFAYHSTRHFPRWVGWLPAHTPKLQSIAPPLEPRVSELS